MDGEKWMPIKGFIKFYAISNMGRVKTLYRWFITKHNEGYPVKEKILKFDKGRYLRVTLSVSHKQLRGRYLVHRLVAIAFHPRIRGKNQVNHKNGIKHDNRDVNVEWSTQKENILHAINILQIKWGPIGMTGKKCKTSKPIKQIDLVTNTLIVVWDCLEDIKRAKVASTGGVIDCCKGRRKSYVGFKWKYA